jgi:smad nuclear-interacting protein 1
MSHSTSNDNPPRRGGSRWGDRRAASPSSSHLPAPAPTATTTTTATNISDEDALQALLTSATEREQARSAAATATTNNNNNNNNNRKRTRPGEDRRDGPAAAGQQRLVNNDSYYGPEGGGGGGGGRREDVNNGGGGGEDRRRRQRRDEEPRRPASKVERDLKPSSNNADGGEDADNNDDNNADDDKPPPAYKPNFGLSGALAKDTGGGGNVYKGVVLKFQEPPEARAPNTAWRLYVFKGKEVVETLHISKQSAYLCGRNQDICDIHMAHPSLSGQHAVLQYRALPLVLKDDDSNSGKLSCQPYILDLESTNGTFLNGVRIDGARYYQLKKGDVLTFGGSQREYVLLTENTTALR